MSAPPQLTFVGACITSPSKSSMIVSITPAGVIATTLFDIGSVTHRLPSWSKPQPSVSPSSPRCSAESGRADAKSATALPSFGPYCSRSPSEPSARIGKRSTLQPVVWHTYTCSSAGSSVTPLANSISVASIVVEPSVSIRNRNPSGGPENASLPEREVECVTQMRPCESTCG